MTLEICKIHEISSQGCYPRKNRFIERTELQLSILPSLIAPIIHRHIRSPGCKPGKDATIVSLINSLLRFLQTFPIGNRNRRPDCWVQKNVNNFSMELSKRSSRKMMTTGEDRTRWIRADLMSATQFTTLRIIFRADQRASCPSARCWRNVAGHASSSGRNKLTCVREEHSRRLEGPATSRITSSLSSPARRCSRERRSWNFGSRTLLSAMPLGSDPRGGEILIRQFARETRVALTWGWWWRSMDDPRW